MLVMIQESRFDTSTGDTNYFSFGYTIVDGVPQIGFGGDSGVFKVGVTTKRLLLKMNRNPATFVFHWDATYKINSLAYPVLICGISDPSGKFHPVAFFIISQESTEEYVWALRELMKAYKEVVGRDLKIDYVMGDAGKAPVAATKALQPELNVKTLLMCFYHMVACVVKRLGAVHVRVKALVSRYMFKMHESRHNEECDMHWYEAKAQWETCEVLVFKDFVEYFQQQWIFGDCCNWQVYHTPSGFPTTNNPCELFNKHFKGTTVLTLYVCIVQPEDVY
jgi:hypothetical protein